ncbi:MAG: bifunctional 5,10-methylene-tetrahydrofolate dehydrogenase/5,10-methylene-tetrahydrofolate cyclohydrolase [Bacteroidetes bacterium 4572_77]|nr:MAG: bifunctional 5,10-methylene-tetrahydrofolate dehydrogenase/5,10-methylene-tetrahydrofolate cyclohydrolase [Bacteroidetes bacterium 4572_77]
MAIIINGKETAQMIRSELKQSTKKMLQAHGVKPGIAILLIGDDPASNSYVTSKEKACAEVGYYSIINRQPASISEKDTLEIIEKWNNDNSIHGILVQLPLPKHINEDNIVNAISPEKDVDGFHPTSVGKMILQWETFLPCTPAGIMELLRRYEIETKGKHVVVVGRSLIVGRPIANLMSMKDEHANSVVTLCHSAAGDISYYTKQADILIVAVGKPEMIKADDVKEGVVIIDVGMNYVDDASKKRGYRICGDCDFPALESKASFITPVPGGVGPMTIAMLMKNTLIAAERTTTK